MIAVLFDHLWQSTLFACAAGVLALALRGHAARVRYWLWFAASIKFLIPFSILVTVGSWLAPGAAPAALPPSVAAFAGRASAPFSAMAPQLAKVASVHGATPVIATDMPTLLLGLWLTGTALVLAIWSVRWLRLRAVVRSARPVDVRAPVPVRMSGSVLLEPGLAGLWRPVILLPEGLATRLSPRELDCVIAHEVCHLRRRDNLTAAIHMAVEALFWFYPLTWWLGSRLMSERERACDEFVTAEGHVPEVYAEGILKVCRFYVRAPLACAAGVSGSDLKQRIERIMKHIPARRLGITAKLQIALAGLASLAAPLLYGLLASPAVGAAAIGQPSAPTGAEIAHLRYEQSRPQKQVPFNPRDFDKFAGYYRLTPVEVFHVFRKGDRYFAQLTGQPAVEWYPESSDEFFATVVAAQISFNVNANGKVTGLVLHQNGLLMPARKVSAGAAKALRARLATRLKRNEPSPGTRAMVLRYIDGLEEGAPRYYNTMTPELAAAARQQYAKTIRIVRGQGAFESLRFARVAPNGWDMYVASFTHGKLVWLIAPLDAQGKVSGLLLRSYP